METQSRLALPVVALLLSAFRSSACSLNTQLCNSRVDGSIFDYGAKALNESRYIPLRQYAGKYVLIVNLATF